LEKSTSYEAVLATDDERFQFIRFRTKPSSTHELLAISFSTLKNLKVSSWFVIFEIDYIYPVLNVSCKDPKGLKRN
jgi:hypothetical protein